MTFEEFRRKYPARQSKRPVTHPQHALLLDSDDGLARMSDVSGCLMAVMGALTNIDEAKIHRYLWVYREFDEVRGLECCSFAALFPNGWIKHTNLTGNTTARSGGEMWILDDATVVLNGSSGRYGPDTEEGLIDAGKVLSTFGFKVGVMRFYPGGVPRAIIEDEEDILWI